MGYNIEFYPYLPKIWIYFFLHFDFRSDPESVPDPEFFFGWAGFWSVEKNVGSSSLDFYFRKLGLPLKISDYLKYIDLLVLIKRSKYKLWQVSNIFKHVCQLLNRSFTEGCNGFILACNLVNWIFVIVLMQVLHYSFYPKFVFCGCCFYVTIVAISNWSWIVE